MLRKLLGTGLLLATLAACTEFQGKQCTSDAECGTGECNEELGYCVAVVEIPEDGGTCPFTCAEYEACTSSGCRPRFTGLAILAPTEGSLFDGGTVQVEAQIEPNPALTSTPRYPETLAFSATLSDGGTAGTLGAVSRTDGRYTAQWTVPNVEDQVTLAVAHPSTDAGLSDTAIVRVDTVAPVFTVAFSSPPLRSDGGTTQADQRDPTSGYEGAFRRDESVTVAVSANEPVNNVALTVIGIGPDGTAGQAQQPVTVQPGGTCDGNPAFCGNVTVDLSTPEMRDVRGTMGFRINGQDRAGNINSASSELKVTRWKWAFDAAENIVGSPAIGSRGTVYFGTSVNNGRVVAVGPDGTRKWATTIGQVLGSLAVGAFSSNEEYVYAAGKSTVTSALYALRGSDGTEKNRCSYTGLNDLPSAIAVGTIGGVESAATIYHSSPQRRIVQIRPAASAGSECFEIVGGGIPISIAGGAVVIKDQNVFYGTPDFTLTSYDLSVDVNTPRTGWPQGTRSGARGLALLDNNIYGGASNSDDPSLGSLFTIPVTGGTSGGSVSIVYPGANTSRVFNLAIGVGNIAYFGAETATNRDLLALTLANPSATPASASDVGTLRGAPILGKNERIYTVNTLGRVAVWSTGSLTQQWYADLPQGSGAADISPTLDCRRDPNGNAVAGSPLGTLYVAASSKVYALIVDSPGLDPNAPWPKYQHDARNTGNPATPITNCP